MAAPVPLSWEAFQPSGLLAQSSYGGDGGERIGPARGFVLAPDLLLELGRRVAPVGRQELLLWWGRLLLEGG